MLYTGSRGAGDPEMIEVLALAKVVILYLRKKEKPMTLKEYIELYLKDLTRYNIIKITKIDTSEFHETNNPFYDVDYVTDDPFGANIRTGALRHTSANVCYINFKAFISRTFNFSDSAVTYIWYKKELEWSTAQKTAALKALELAYAIS